MKNKLAKKKLVKTKRKTVTSQKTSKRVGQKAFVELRSLLSNNLLYLCMYTFTLLIVVNALLYTGWQHVQKETEATRQVLAAEDIATEIRPLLIQDRVKFPILSAQGAIVVDLDSGESLYSKNPDSSLLPASTVKIMTALIALENLPENMPVRINGVKVEGQKMGLTTGQEISVGNLLEGLLVFSANDAAEVLADTFPGGRKVFVDEMNNKVKKLGLINTKYNNPTGIDGFDQVTTARDLVAISEYAMSNPRFADIVRKESVQIVNTDGEVFRNLRSTNQLLGKVDGVLGVKTGWTENARENLVSYVERDGKRVLVALLGSQDRFGESEELIEWVFDNYEWVKTPVQLR